MRRFEDRQVSLRQELQNFKLIDLTLTTQIDGIFRVSTLFSKVSVFLFILPVFRVAPSQASELLQHDFLTSCSTRLLSV